MKLIGYVRVSSEGQADNTSLEEQELKIKSYCVALNHELVDIYQDVQSGGKSENRKGLQTAITALLDGKADGLIALKVDRVARNAADLLTLIDKTLQPNNKALVLITEGVDTATATGKLVVTMLAGVAEFEKSQINERTANGKKARAKTSDYANGGAPKFGCKADNKNLVADDNEQQIIDIIRRHHKSGKSPQKIADFLNKNNLPSKRGGTWSKTTVARVVDRIYANTK